MTAIDIIREALATSAMTRYELAALAGVGHQRICALMKDMADLVFIESWDCQPKGPRVPRYRIGTQPDAPKPPKLTSTEKSRRYRATENGRKVARECEKRWCASERGKEYNAARSKANYAKKKYLRLGLEKFDPLMAAIMGRRETSA